MNRFWMWAVGAGALVWGLKVLADNKKRPGELFFRVHFGVQNEGQHQGAIGKLTGALKNFAVSRPCSGLPQIKELLSTKAGTPTTGSKLNMIDATFMADWTHDRLGPVRPEVLQCVTRYLKGLEPEISIDSVSVERIS